MGDRLGTLGAVGFSFFFAKFSFFIEELMKKW
jgi:hypothetical protein